MSCGSFAGSFVNFVFTPTIGVFTTDDVRDILSTTNLSFSELLLPFSGPLEDAFLKDGSNITHVIKKLCVRFTDVAEVYNPLINREFILHPSLFPTESSAQFYFNGKTFNIPCSTPWFDSWRHLFICNLGCYEHDFLTRYLGCLFVVSTRNPDPIGAFSNLIQQHIQLSKTQPFRWFSQTNIVKFFILINDTDTMSIIESGKMFQSITSAYGNANCYLLNLALSSQNSTNNTAGDIWIRYLLPHGWSLNAKTESVLKPHITRPHGEHLSRQDQDKIRAFVGDFVSRILIPWTESTIKALNDQAAHRLRKSKSFFSVTRKFFSQSSLNETASSVIHKPDSNGFLLEGGSNSAATSSIYPDDAPELQMRRLADLLFLFQQYESAHQIYDLLKRDFKHRSAWLHYAGTQEMSALSTFLQGALSQRQYPQHQMDDAILTYASKCKNPNLALRAVLLHTEALKSRELFAEMAVCFIRLTDVDGFLTGGLLLEQAGHCCLRGKHPLLRHFAMRMALAGIRFARAKQPHLSARSFSLALEILSSDSKSDIGWTLALDHINENLAHQRLVLNQSKEALQPLWSLLSPHSDQLEATQIRFLRQFLTIYNQVNLPTGGSSKWPELSLPIVDKNHFKVMLGSPIRKSNDDVPIEARGTAFSDDENDNAEDLRTFSTQCALLPSNFATDIFPPLALTFGIPDWMTAAASPPSEMLENDQVDDLKLHGEAFIRFLYSRPSYPLPRLAIFRRLKALICLHSGLELLDDAIAGGLVVLTVASATKQNPKGPSRWCRIPIGETLTVQIQLYNSWKIPLVLTDVHLLWQASFTFDSQPETGFVISNEDNNLGRLREAKNYINTSVISEFYMLSGDRKSIELSLQPRRAIDDLQITGIAFKLDITSPCQSSLSDLPSPTTPPSPLPLASSLELLSSPPQLDVSVRAIEALRDPLTSTTPAKPVSVLSSGVQGKVCFPSPWTDPRLHWDVIAPQALLKVSFDGFPQSLFEGETYGNSLILANIGSRGLGNLCVTTSWPSFFLLSNASPCIVASFPDSVSLEASESIVERFWLHAPVGHSQRENDPLTPTTLATHSRQIHMVFGYVTKGNLSELRYVQHEASVQLLASLQFSATCTRTQGSSVDSLIITLRCKNVSLQHSFEVGRLACSDPNWSLRLLAPADVAVSQNGVHMRPTQEMTLCIRATRQNSTTPSVYGSAAFSSIVLHSDFVAVDALSTPHAQFFQLSLLAAQKKPDSGYSRGNPAAAIAAPETDLQPKNLYLLAFWRFSDPNILPTTNQRLGQSHVRVVYAYASKAPPCPSGNNLAQMLASIPSLLPLSSLLRLRLYHPFQVVHDFDSERQESMAAKSSSMASISIVVEIYNASSCPVIARISTNEDNTSRNAAALQEESATPLPRVLWTGVCVRQMPLAAGQIHRLHLRAFVACPGVYEVNSLCLKASVSAGNPPLSPLLPQLSRFHDNEGWDEGASVSIDAATISAANTSAPFVRQLCDFSSPVVVIGNKSVSK